MHLEATGRPSPILAGLPPPRILMKMKVGDLLRLLAADGWFLVRPGTLNSILKQAGLK